MAVPLTEHFVTLTTEDLDHINTLSPHEKLDNTSNFTNEILIQNYTPQTHLAKYSKLQQQRPKRSFQHVKTKNRHLAQRTMPMKKKSLNSYMAFRAFYKRIFPNLQQKDASSYLTLLWRNDPFKAKWSIVAKAYSTIRDIVGKPGAPLDTFLDLVCPAIGIIRAEDYLQAFKWAWEQPEDGGPTVLKQIADPDLRRFDHRIVHTTMTEISVIEFCGAMGYMPSSLVAHIPTSHTRQGLLASAPAMPAQSDTLEDPLAGLLAMDPADMQDFEWHQYQWTVNVTDLYIPDGTNSYISNLLHGSPSSMWDIHEPQALDFLNPSGMESGYLDNFGDSLTKNYGL